MATFHSWTPVPLGLAWKAFAAASRGGGDPPRWTLQDDPRTAVPPPDAAGELWRLGDGDTQIPEDVDAAARVMSEVVLAGLPATPLAAYYSSADRRVYLLVCGATAYIVIARPEPDPRLGASEENLEEIAPGATCLWPYGDE